MRSFGIKESLCLQKAENDDVNIVVEYINMGHFVISQKNRFSFSVDPHDYSLFQYGVLHFLHLTTSMAFRGSSWKFFSYQFRRRKSLLTEFFEARYCLPYLHSAISFSKISALDDLSNSLDDERQIKKQKNIDESFVLNELSNLLPLSRNSSVTNLYKKCNNLEKQIEARAVDGFLLPAEKLRGIFVQNLRGRTAIENALSNSKVDLNVDVVAEVVNRGGLDGEKMVVFFNWAIKQPKIAKDIYTYHIILKALGRRKFFNHMIGILHDMMTEGISPSLETISIAIDSFVRARRVSKAIQVFRSLEEFGLSCDTESLNALLQSLCCRSHVGTANSLMNSMKGKIPINGVTYNIILSGWSKYGKVSEMERILEAMLADGIKPDNSTFSHLIEGLTRAGRVEGAVEVFDSMRERGCIPDTSAHNAMIYAFLSVGDFDKCMKLYKSMLSNNCEPNVNTYTELITAFLKARKVADALEMFDEMLTQGIIPTTGTITSFIEPLCSYGPPHAAMMVYKKAKNVGCKISVTAYKLLLMRLSKFGKCGMLLKLWNEMQECGHSSDMEAYEFVITGLCNIGQLENAVLVMEESLQKGFCPSRPVYSRLSNKLLDSNKAERAYKLYLKIKDARYCENSRRYWHAKGWHF